MDATTGAGDGFRISVFGNPSSVTISNDRRPLPLGTRKDVTGVDTFVRVIWFIGVTLFVAGFTRPLPRVLSPVEFHAAARHRSPNKVFQGAFAQLENPAKYDGNYYSIAYPNGDVPANRGACADVVVRALRYAGFDLQRLIHTDARSGLYPRISTTDSNIDHRRVQNQEVFFSRHGKVLTTEVSRATLDQWKPGDIVCWRLPGDRPHTGIVSDTKRLDGVLFVIHNTWQVAEEDVLTNWKIVGHYRYPESGCEFRATPTIHDIMWPVAQPGSSVYRNTWPWNLGFSAYWFATSYKWFILLLVVIPGQVQKLVPDGEKNTAWGAVYALGALWGVLGPALFGGWSDRFDSKWGHRQPFIAAGALVTVCALLFMMNSPSLIILGIGYMLLQLGEDIGQGPYAAMMPEIVPSENAGKSSSVMNLLQSLARLVSGIVSLLLKTTQLIYVAVAVVQLLGAGTTLYTVRNVRRTRPVHELSTEPFWKRWWAPWKSPDFRWVWFTRFLSTLAFSMVSNYLLFYFKDMFKSYAVFGYDLGSPEKAAVFLAMLMSVLGVVGALIAAKLADSWGRKPLIYLGGFVIFLVLIPFALARDMTTVFLLAIPFGIGFGIYVSADWALATDVLPDRDDAGTQMGVWSMSVTSVQIVAGAFGGLVDWGNRVGHGFGYVGLIWTAGAIFVISTLLIKQVKASR